MNALKKTLKQPKPQVTLGKAPEKAGRLLSFWTNNSLLADLITRATRLG